MSDLSIIEKTKIEKFFGMKSGYVLDFSDRTFQEFIADSAGKDIFDRRYDYHSGSKANRLRAFWKLEPNHVNGKLLSDLLDYCRDMEIVTENEALLHSCRRIADRLSQAAPISDIESISEGIGEKDFGVLSEQIRASINRNQPEVALDRLHTFVVRFVRNLCDKHGIVVTKEKPLHSLFGEYVKELKRLGLLESEMTERIMKSAISILESFNQVRNNQSLAHDNPMLNYRESLLILGYVDGLIGFINSLEKEREAESGPNSASVEVEDDLPF